MKIYTKNGDSGFSSILGKNNISKDHVVFDVVGSIDELNASLGVASNLSSSNVVKSVIKIVQNDLFILGANIASSDSKDFPVINEKQVLGLEKSIDSLSANLPVQTNFIIPSGSVAGSFLHLSRSVCRRSERLLVNLMNSKFVEVNDYCLKYLNRLSDLIFVLAREEDKDSKEVNPDYTLA